MSECITIGFRQAAIILAEELDYSRAAERLSITTADLRTQISTLESYLYLHIFKPDQNKVELTKEGHFLIEAFREAVTLHNQSFCKSTNQSR